MPNEASTKYNNELDHLLDYMQPPEEYANQERWRDYAKQVTFKKFCTMLKLLDYYEIDPASSNPWFHLSWKLAEDHVKAMKFSKKSSSQVWNWKTQLALCGLAELGKTQGLQHRDLYKIAEGTILEKLITPETSAKTISNQLSKFKNSTLGSGWIKLVDEIPDQKNRPDFWKEILNPNFFVPD